MLEETFPASRRNILVVQRCLVECRAWHCTYPQADLAHQQDRVEDDEEHDEVLEGRRGDEAPDVVADSCLRLRNVDLLGLDLDDVGDTGLLQEETGQHGGSELVSPGSCLCCPSARPHRAH